MHEFCNIVQPDYPLAPYHVGLGNCPAVMLSPAVYREVVLPDNLWLRQQCSNFSLHHCGVFDKYAELYVELAPDSLDVGAGSDYKLLRKYFLNTPCSFIVDNGQIEGRTREEIDEVVRHIITDGGPIGCISRLRAYGISRYATDENLYDFRTSAKRLGVV